MTRLTNELESVYVDERRDALDKLQNEHIEELRALTNRYTANEEELRAEVLSLRVHKSQCLTRISHQIDRGVARKPRA